MHAVLDKLKTFDCIPFIFTTFFNSLENLELFRVGASNSRRKSLQIEELEKSNLELRRENEKLKQNLPKPSLEGENMESLKDKILRLQDENASLVDEEQKLIKEIKSYKQQKSFIGVRNHKISFI